MGISKDYFLVNRNNILLNGGVQKYYFLNNRNNVLTNKQVEMVIS
jgi:hypothetical protein